MRKKLLKIIKVVNILTYPGALIILYFIYPIMLNTNKNIKYLLVWFVVFGVGVVYLNHRFILTIGRVKDTANILDLFSTWGRTKVRQNPNNYFKPEDYRKYKSNFRYMLIYGVIAGISLFIIGVVFVRQGS